MLLQRRIVFGLTVLLLSFVAACATRVPLYAAPTNLPTGVFVKVKEAYVSGDRLYVKTWMMNGSKEPITIDRDGIALRLPGGRVLSRAEGTFTQHKPYQLAPGAGRDVHVDFKQDDGFEGLASATLIVGGISFGVDPMPRVAGEIPLSNVYRSAPPPPPAPPPAAAPASPAPAAPAEPPAPQAAGTPVPE